MSVYTGRNLVLIGLMGTGKSTVGRLLADRLGRPLRDTDAEVEHSIGRSIAELVSSEGERAFRDEEAEAVRAVAALRGQVIAVGGGAVLRPDNVTQLRSTGELVWLDADVDTLTARLDADEVGRRPLLGDDVAASLQRLREGRARAYAAASAHRVNTTGRSPEEVAEAILAWAERRSGLLTREERDGLAPTPGTAT